jgi:hypothetical protein
MTAATLRRRRASLTTWALSAIITALALADAAVHVRLDYVLFNGKLWGSSRPGPPRGVPGFPPGGPSGTPAGSSPGGSQCTTRRSPECARRRIRWPLGCAARRTARTSRHKPGAASTRYRPHHGAAAQRALSAQRYRVRRARRGVLGCTSPTATLGLARRLSARYLHDGLDHRLVGRRQAESTAPRLPFEGHRSSADRRSRDTSRARRPPRPAAAQLSPRHNVGSPQAPQKGTQTLSSLGSLLWYLPLTRWRG